MKRIATIVNAAGAVTGLVHGPDASNQSITVNGRTWRFEFDRMLGPTWLKADGFTPRSNQNPPPPVWVAFDRWFKRWNKVKGKPTL